MTWSRRKFLVAALAAGGGLAGIRLWRTAPRRRALLGPIVDFHVHLFGAGDAPGLAPREKCFLSETQKRHRNFRFLKRLLGLAEHESIDEAYLRRLVEQLRGSSMTKAVLLAHDARYDAEGRLDLARTTSVFVPNDYLFRVVNQHPDLFIPCPSINPKRRDALDELERCVARGARVLKIHPPTQNVDPADPQFRPFYRHCARLGVIVMVHTGLEHQAETVGDDYADPRRLELALNEGCTVVACHAGLGAFFDRQDFFLHLPPLMRRYDRLYCDTAVLASMGRWRNLPRLLKDPLVLGRTIHGSDFPFPSNALVFWNRLHPADLLPLLGERNLLERDFRLKRALGLPDSVFERGAGLLGLKDSA